VLQALDRIEGLLNRQITKEQNGLLRSAYQIAEREGKDTNWTAFLNNLQRELLREAGVSGSTDEQTVLRATCTPKTYRLPPT
jgi:hypothetical protein